MPKNNESSVSEYFSLPNQGLQAYFGRVRKGSDIEYRTHFYSGQSPQEIVKHWMRQAEPLLHEWPTLVAFEKDLGKKVGPLSIMKPLRERMNDIESYYTDINLPSVPISERAVGAVVSEWSKVYPLRIRNQQSTLENMKLSTSSGSPFFTKRRNVIGRTVPCEIAMNDPYVVQMLPGGYNPYACAVLGWRGQEGGPEWDDVKQRVVWMFPFAVNLAELQLYQVLIEAAQREQLVPAWISNDAVDVRITKLFDTKAPNDLIVCTDFSKFDQHFNSDMQNCAADILSRVFRDDSITASWLHDVFPIKYMIPLMYDYGVLKFGRHGMGSGSGGTNADETLAHRALQYEAALSHGARLNTNSMCLGDDGILTYPGITVEDVVESYSSHGQEMNTTKQYASTSDCVYLRRWHHRDYRIDGVCKGVYSTCRALGKLAERERRLPEWDDKLEVLRELSIIENVKWHPLRDQFLEFCIKGSRHRLGLSIPGFFDSLNKLERRVAPYAEDFIGYNRANMKDEGSILDWWCVQELLKLK